MPFSQNNSAMIRLNSLLLTTLFLLSLLQKCCPYGNNYLLRKRDVRMSMSKRKDISMVGTGFQRKHMIRNSGNVLNEVNEYNENVEGLKSNNERRFILKSFLTALLPAKLVLSPRKVLAAPPFAVMSEELGFFPVTNSVGQTVNIPAKVKRASTDQSILLAKHLKAVRSIVLMKLSCKICFSFFLMTSYDYIYCSPNPSCMELIGVHIVRIRENYLGGKLGHTLLMLNAHRKDTGLMP